MIDRLAGIDSAAKRIVDEVGPAISSLQDVLRALRSSGIHVVAIHNHMTAEQPRMLFLHYWGVGPTEDLARALRAALDYATPR